MQSKVDEFIGDELGLMRGNDGEWIAELKETSILLVIAAQRQRTLIISLPPPWGRCPPGRMRGNKDLSIAKLKPL